MAGSRELAILVTAKNMASGVLKDVRGDIKGIQAEAKRGLQNTARNLGMAAAAGGVLVATQVKAGLESLVELERLEAQTAAVLKSTGSAAAGSVDDIRRRAEELERLTTVDDKVIQNAENILLTFTQIREDAFEPTLKAAIDMNAALGGDDESLQNVLIQVGKAVNDPITGLTALRRVGVSFTEQQKDQIKAMVEAGDVAGAQALVLAELNKEFGGSAAAQADTYSGKMRRVADAIEDAQMALATAFLPVLERAGDELQSFLSDPENLQMIEDFGATLADGLQNAIDIAKKLPWDAIGTTFSLMGQGAKLVLDMFTKLPPWVQTAVLTGWGLNKLTGGALGNIAIDLFKNRGATPANPLFVQPVAGGIGGGGGPVVGGGGKGAGGRIIGGIGGVLAALGVAQLAQEFHDDVQQAGVDFGKTLFPDGAPLDFLNPSEWQWPIGSKNMPDWAKFDPGSGGHSGAKSLRPDSKSLNARNFEAAAATAARQGAQPVVESVSQVRDRINTAARTAAVHDTTMINTARQQTTQLQSQISKTEQVRALQATQSSRLASIEGLNRSSLGTLAQIRNKKASVTINTTVNVSLQEWQRKQISSIRAASNSGGFI